ncbi:MAG: hypothetical protein ACU0DW_07585 [Shimia sp.]
MWQFCGKKNDPSGGVFPACPPTTHIRNIWANPVRHGLCERPTDWPYSSIHRDVRMGRVEAEWTGDAQTLEVGEP